MGQLRSVYVESSHANSRVWIIGYDPGHYAECKYTEHGIHSIATASFKGASEDGIINWVMRNYLNVLDGENPSPIRPKMPRPCYQRLLAKGNLSRSEILHRSHRALHTPLNDHARGPPSDSPSSFSLRTRICSLYHKKGYRHILSASRQYSVGIIEHRQSMHAVDLCLSPYRLLTLP